MESFMMKISEKSALNIAVNNAGKLNLHNYEQDKTVAKFMPKIWHEAALDTLIIPKEVDSIVIWVDAGCSDVEVFPDCIYDGVLFRKEHPILQILEEGGITGIFLTRNESRDDKAHYGYKDFAIQVSDGTSIEECFALAEENAKRGF